MTSSGSWFALRTEEVGCSSVPFVHWEADFRRQTFHREVLTYFDTEFSPQIIDISSGELLPLTVTSKAVVLLMLFYLTTVAQPSI